MNWQSTSLRATREMGGLRTGKQSEIGPGGSAVAVDLGDGLQQRRYPEEDSHGETLVPQSEAQAYRHTLLFSISVF